MHFTSIITVLSAAMLATAKPATSSSKPATTVSHSATSSSHVASGTTSATPSPSAGTTCSTGQTASCCSSTLVNSFGVQCVTLSLLSLLGQSCPQAASVACCPNNGIQNGLVNIGTVCVPVSVAI